MAMNLSGYTPTPALSGLSGVNSQIKNRFDTYKSPYDYENMKKFLDEIYGEYTNQLNQQASEATADLTGDATQRMLSRGIQGGSVVEDTLSGIGSKVNKGKLNALSNLGISKAGQNLNLMDLFNTRDFATQQAATNVDLSNVGNALNQAQAIASAYLQNRGMDIQEKSQPGTLSDIFSGLGDLGSVFASIATMFPELFAAGEGATALATLPVLSDISVKENISKVGVQNGFNIYDFNYIGDTRRFRGVIANEVEISRPDAVTTINGIKHVYYDKIGIKFQEV